ncbi:MAG: Na(+)-translocating NADH-quinone reductase subunit C [Succinivibrio sp.]|nr:Na(+)-translocating NADH-quinone reductase subunit C [Succinivibrio sp.]
MNKDSVLGTFAVIISFCLVCSVLVSMAVVALNPFKAAAIADDRQKNIIKVSGFEVEGKLADTYKKHIEAHLIDVATGEIADEGFTEEQRDAYNFQSLAKKPDSSVPIPKDQDLAGILRHSKLMPVYFSKDDEGNVVRVILPFYGQGLWSTCYGYLALDPADGNTIEGITFYDHGETPGLGGEIENPRWQQQWVNKKFDDEEGNYKFRILKNPDTTGPGKDFEVDALSGATLTTNGVDHFTHYWFGDAYKPFLAKLRNGEIINHE